MTSMRHKDYYKTERGVNFRRRGPNMGDWEIEEVPKDLVGSDEETRLVARTVYSADRSIYEYHGHLLDVGSSELSIAHKFAEALQRRFAPEYWSVDCEYNRNAQDVKRISRKSIGRRGAIVRPDVIIHNRGGEDNLAAIEIKKTSCPLDDIELDKLKLLAFKKELGYRNAFLVVVYDRTARDHYFEAGVYRITEDGEGSCRATLVDWSGDDDELATTA